MINILESKVVYTAIIDSYDTLKEPVVSDCSCVCFSDTNISCQGWIVRGASRHYDNTRDSRRFKILPHRKFSHPTNIWIDGSAKLMSVVDAERLLGDADIAVHKHPTRKCLFDEAEACVRIGRGDLKIVGTQMKRYLKEGVPSNLGLFSTGFIVRRNTPAVVEFNEMWWKEVLNGSKRDQLSFPYCVWKTGINVSVISGTIYDNPVLSFDEVHAGFKREE